jgi:hypothetical protein
MSKDSSSAALSIPPRTTLTAPPEYGPLVRAQSVKRPGASLGPLWALLGLGTQAAANEAGAWLTPVALATLVGMAVAIDRAPGSWRRWRMRRCPAWNGAGAPPTGTVRVSGRVRALGQPFRIPGEDQPVIFAHTRYAQARSDGTPGKFQREDVRGLTLEIDLPTGMSVRLAPDVIRLVDRERAVPEVGREVRWKLGAAWQGWRKGKLRRGCLREGDRVEAVGDLVRDVNVQGAGGPGRGVPMIHWLMPAWEGGVWIRKVGGGDRARW